VGHLVQPSFSLCPCLDGAHRAGVAAGRASPAWSPVIQGDKVQAAQRPFLLQQPRPGASEAGGGIKASPCWRRQGRCRHLVPAPQHLSPSASGSFQPQVPPGSTAPSPLHKGAMLTLLIGRHWARNEPRRVNYSSCKGLRGSWFGLTAHPLPGGWVLQEGRLRWCTRGLFWGARQGEQGFYWHSRIESHLKFPAEGSRHRGGLALRGLVSQPGEQGCGRNQRCFGKGERSV